MVAFATVASVKKLLLRARNYQILETNVMYWLAELNG